MKAILNNYRQSPRKVRLVADMIRGKKVSEALEILSFRTKRASSPIKKLLESAISNAKINNSKEAEGLSVKEVRVDGGVVMKRMMPRARGASNVIRKRTSSILITLADFVPPVAKKVYRKSSKAKVEVIKPETKEKVS